MRQASVLAESPGARGPATGTYVAVIAVEALVVAALWWFSRHFSA